MIIVFDAENQRIHAVHEGTQLSEVVDKYPDMYPMPIELPVTWADDPTGFRPGQFAEVQVEGFAEETRLTWNNGRWELDQAGVDYWTARYARNEETKEGYVEIMSIPGVAGIKSREEARQFASAQTQGATTADVLDAMRGFMGDLLWLSVSVGRNGDPDNDAIFIPEVDQVMIEWKEFTDAWPGWGFHATFNRADISALGLKVYNHTGAYLYALTFQATDEPNIVETETPAGFRFPTKADGWQFEVIAGSSPVSDKVALTPADERIFIDVDF